MIKVYTRTQDGLKTRLLDWFKHYNIEVEYKPFKNMNYRDLKEVYDNMYEGIDGLLIGENRRSKLTEEMKINFMELDSLNTIEEKIMYLSQNTKILKNSFMTNGKISLSGFNIDEIRCFIPRELKNGMRENMMIKLHEYENIHGYVENKEEIINY